MATPGRLRRFSHFLIGRNRPTLPSVTGTIAGTIAEITNDYIDGPNSQEVAEYMDNTVNCETTWRRVDNGEIPS